MEIDFAEIDRLAETDRLTEIDRLTETDILTYSLRLDILAETWLTCRDLTDLKRLG